MDERQSLSLRRLSEHCRGDQGSAGQNGRSDESMNPFGYLRASDARSAVSSIAAKPRTKFLGGGTNLIDLMKMGVEKPAQLIDISRLPLAQVEELPGGKGVRIGAL